MRNCEPALLQTQSSVHCKKTGRDGGPEKHHCEPTPLLNASHDLRVMQRLACICRTNLGWAAGQVHYCSRTTAFSAPLLVDHEVGSDSGPVRW